MNRRSYLKIILAITTVLLTTLACSPPASTSTPTATPAASVTPYVPPTDTPEATPTPTPEPTPTPTEPPDTSWLPAGTVALYLAGPWDAPQLFALTTSGTAATVDHSAHIGTVLSPSGRWLAAPSGPRPADGVIITNLEDDASFTVDTPADFEVYDMAFDQAESRLALVEVGPPSGTGTTWAITIVDLASEATTRFEASRGGDEAQLPGYPIGWSDSGEDLLLDTFVPYTEGGFQGISRITLPPGTGPAEIETLARSELVPAEAYQTYPRLSPDGTHLIYLARDYDYTPEDYALGGYDLAVNQLWVLDLASESSTQLANATDGDALARTAAWSPDGGRILFARGRYDGDVFASLQFQIYDLGSDTIEEVGELPLPSEGYINTLHWVTDEIALYTASDQEGTAYIYHFNLSSGAETVVTTAQYVSVMPIQ